MKNYILNLNDEVWHKIIDSSEFCNECISTLDLGSYKVMALCYSTCDLDGYPGLGLTYGNSWYEVCIKARRCDMLMEYPLEICLKNAKEILPELPEEQVCDLVTFLRNSTYDQLMEYISR